MKTKRLTRPTRKSPKPARRPASITVVIFGAGGNIGSHLVALIARMIGVARLILVDGDRYEQKNLGSQDILPSDVGHPKAGVQARRARRINPRLEVVAIADRIENVPLGQMRGDVILACLHSKEGRSVASEIAWRLGVLLIDAGVEASVMLARVSTYRPAPGQPCVCCFWDQRDYAQFFTRNPCQPDEPAAPPSNSPACLGALAASWQAIECRKFIAGQLDRAAFGREVLIDAATGKLFATTLRRHPECRFDHQTWKISPLTHGARDLSLRAALALGRGNGSASLAFGGQAIVEKLDCPGCGFSRKIFRLQNRIASSVRTCERCGREMLAAGFNMQARMTAASLGPRRAALPLARIGLRAGDVISVGDGRRERHYELGGLKTSGGKP